MHVNANNPIMYTDPLGLSPRDTRFKDFGENTDQEKGDYNDWDFGLGGGMSSPFGTLNMELSQSNYGTLMPLWEQKSMRNEMFTSAWNNGLTGDDALEVGIAYARAFNMWGNEGVVESAVAARINYDFAGGIDWQYAVAFEDTGITDPEKDGGNGSKKGTYNNDAVAVLIGPDIDLFAGIGLSFSAGGIYILQGPDEGSGFLL